MPTLQKHRQTQARIKSPYFGLPMLAVTGPTSDMGRITLILKNMIVYCSSLVIDTVNSSDSSIVYNYALTVPAISVANASDNATIALPATSTEIIQGIQAKIIADLFTAFSVTVTSSDIVFEDLTYISIPRSFSNPSLAVNTSRQPSTTRDTMVNASIDITSTISLTTGQTGKVALQYADNTGFTTNVVNVQSATNGNTGSLTIGLNLSQVYTAALTGIVPANKFYRLVTTNVTGTPTYGTPVIQEVLL